MANIRTSIWYQGVILGGFCLVTSVILALGHDVSAHAIADREKEDLTASLEQVIPADLRLNDMTADTVTISSPDGPTTVYRARSGGRVTAVAYRVTGEGYGGKLVIVMGVASNGEILGVRVISHHETPGLGDRIDIRKSRWVDAFSGKSLGNTGEGQWAVKKDGGIFDQFSGATITPRGVVHAVHSGLALFAAHRQRMLDLSTAKSAPVIPCPCSGSAS